MACTHLYTILPYLNLTTMQAEAHEPSKVHAGWVGAQRVAH